jgi:hypothetical protein
MPLETDKSPNFEIEITDEMVEAGTKAIALWDSGDLPEWKVVSVYRAMEKAREEAMVIPTQPLAFPAGAEKVR